LYQLNFCASSKTLNKNAWSEQQEDEVSRLATEFKDKLQAENGRIGKEYIQIT